MPIVNGQYVAPTWNNNNHPPVNAEELQAMCDTLENAGTITLENFYNLLPLIYQQITSLSVARYYSGSASVGNYAIFAGGQTGSASTDAVDAYDDSLTRTTPTALSVARYYLAGASVGNYAIFAGGQTGSASSTDSNIVDSYNESLTLGSVTGLTEDQSRLTGASNYNYAIFTGGYTAYGAIDAYDSSLAHSTPSVASGNNAFVGGASLGSYAVFAGGSYTSVGVQSAYDTSLTRTPIDPLVDNRTSPVGGSSEKYVIFVGGYIGNSNPGLVDSYDSNLTHSVPDQLPYMSQNGACATIGKYILYMGTTGNSGSSSAPPDDYCFALPIINSYRFSVTAFSKYYFEGVTDEPQIVFSDTEISGTGELNGYIQRGFNLSGYNAIPQS